MGHAVVTIVLFALLLSAACPMSAAPGVTEGGLSYPLEGMRTMADLEARITRGGCWLAGLPGLPAYNGSHVHAGVDLKASRGDTVYAVAPGVVDPASDTLHRGYGPGWTQGQVVLVRTTNEFGRSYLVVYGHTQDHRVHGGDSVAAGQALGEVGDWLAGEGGPHLHLTVRLGELPAQGWGTPTFGSTPSRPGAECATTALGVALLGYRDPRRLFTGETTAEMLVGCERGVGVHDAFLRRYREGFVAEGQARGNGAIEVANIIGIPVPLGGAEQPLVQGWDQGLVQVFSGGGGGALLLRQSAGSAVWVHGPVWRAYVGAGGPVRLGFPVSEETSIGRGVLQRFERGSISWHEGTGAVVVPY